MATRIKKITIGTPLTTPAATFLQFDSDNVKGIVDSAYIQAKQITYDFLDSAGTLNLIDSSYITGIVNQAYIQENQNLVDSARTLNLIDSSYITGIVNQTYIQENQNLVDSASIINLVDSAYVQERQITYDFLDSAEALNLIDSSYITGIVNQAYIQENQNLVDSASIINLVDSAYVQERQITYDISNFVTQAEIDSAIDALINGAPGALDTLNELAEALNDDSAFSVTITNSIATKLAITDFDPKFDSALTNRSIVPSADLTYSLGDSTHRYKDIFVGGSTIHLGNLRIQDSEGSLVIYSNGEVASINLSGVTTADLTENGNLYYTTSRVDSAINVLVDSAYVQARQVDIFRDSGFITNIIDSSYVQIRQDYSYSSLVGSPNVLDSADVALIVTADLSSDSAVTTQIINNVVDSSFVQLHAIGLDYTSLTNLPDILDSINIIDLVDSAYIQARQEDIFRDSGFVTDIIDSAYVQARQVDIFRDSGFITEIVDSAYITARASTYDSTNTIGLVDSTYVQARQITYDFLDSSEAINLIDSAHVQARQTPQDFAYGSLTGVPNVLDSADVILTIEDAGYATASFVATSVDSAVNVLIDGAPGALDTLNELAAALNDDSDAYNTLLSSINALPDSAEVATIVTSYGYTTYDSTNTIGLVDSAYVQARQITYDFLDSSEAINLIDSAYVQARQTLSTYGDSNVSLHVDSAYVQARQITYTVYTDSDTRSLVDSAYIQERQADIFRDSGFVTEIVDSSYVAFRQNYDWANITGTPNTIAGYGIEDAVLPSDITNALETIDSAYVQARQITYTVYTDSDTTSLVDSAYVQARVTLRDSAFITNIIDSAYVTSRASTYDSTNTIGLVDSAYVQARQTPQDFAYGSLTGAPNVLDSANVNSIVTSYGYTTYDSTNTIGLVDSAYIQARQSFRDSAFVTNILKDGSVDVINISDSSAIIDWNALDGTLNINYDGVSLQIGQEEHIYAKATESISNGDVVMFAGAQGDHILVSKADVTSPGFIDEFIVGVATHDIANNNFGYVTTFGKVRDLNTSSYTEGQLLYLDPTTPGGFVTSKPQSPNHASLIASVLRSHGEEGTILVRPTFGHDLSSAHDVYIDSTTISHNQYLQWDSANGYWTHTTPFFFDSTNFSTEFAAKSTSDLSEGDNLYYTTARHDSDFDARLSGGTGVTVLNGQVSIDQALGTADSVIFGSVTTTGNITIGGNLQVDGTQTVINTQNLSVEDNMFYLNQLESAGSPTLTVDVGWAGNVNDDGTYEHVGMFRDATDNTFKVFEKYLPEPDAATQINTDHASFSLAPFAARTLSGKYLGFDSDFNSKTILDSADVANIIDAAYVQANQITYDNLSEFTNDTHFLDSTTVQNVIDTTYIQANQITYDNLSEFTNDTNFLDSAGVESVIDTAYIQANQLTYDNLSEFTNDTHFLDSTTVQNVIDTAYVQANQITYDNVSELTNDANYLDSTTVQDVIDSAYVTARASTYDSDNTIGLVDSAYVAARVAPFDSSAVARLYYNGTDVKAEATNTGITVTGDVNSTSDRAMKDNIEDLVGALETINQIRPVSFDWKTNGKKSFGVIAQEIEQVIPEIVAQDDAGIKSVGYTQLIPFLIQAIQELQKEVNELKSRL